MKALKSLLAAILGLSGLFLVMWLLATFEAVRVIFFFLILIAITWVFTYSVMYGDDCDCGEDH